MTSERRQDFFPIICISALFALTGCQRTDAPAPVVDGYEARGPIIPPLKQTHVWEAVPPKHARKPQIPTQKIDAQPVVAVQAPATLPQEDEQIILRAEDASIKEVAATPPLQEETLSEHQKQTTAQKEAAAQKLFDDAMFSQDDTHDMAMSLALSSKNKKAAAPKNEAVEKEDAADQAIVLRAPEADEEPLAAPEPISEAPTPPMNERPSAAGFIWPVKGDVVKEFSKDAKKGRNDGLNIKAATGTTVRAAQDGTVVYVGNEIKGFGNLVMIKHAGDWKTAYAHLDKIEVKKGVQVKRGQTLGRAGSTGSVRTPQLHFEIRRGTTPVDPRTLLE